MEAEAPISTMISKGLRAMCPACALWLVLCGTLAGADRPALHVTILEGEGAFNDIHKGLARAPVVEVRDENGSPVENARVVFQLPEVGPSGTFGESGLMYVATTDREGHASAIGLKPNRVEGSFQIVVTVSSQGRTGRTLIRETNTLAGGDRPIKSGRSKWLGILLAVGGAASGGIIAATRGGGSSNSSTASAPTPTTLSAGTVTIGGPR